MVSVLSMKLLHFTVCSSLPLDYVIFEGESQCVCVGVGGNITYDKIPVLLTLRLYTACIFMSFFPMLSLSHYPVCISLSHNSFFSDYPQHSISYLLCGRFFSSLSETPPGTHIFQLCFPRFLLSAALFQSSSNTSNSWTASWVHLQLIETDSPVAILHLSPFLSSFSPVACWFIQRLRGVDSQTPVKRNAAEVEDSGRNSLRCSKTKDRVMPAVD